MAKFGQGKFGQTLFGLSKAPDAESIGGVWLGFGIRKQFAKTWIFQVCPGNGYFGTVLGRLYQKKYAYFVPSTINNPQGQAARDALAVAVSNWKTVLTPTEKNEYNERAAHGERMSGYNLYVKEYVEAHA
jgi:hypothetical protein